MNILLIDKRVSRYEDIITAIDHALAVGIVFDYDTDTFETIKTRISEALQLHAASGGGATPGAASASASVSVGLIQHNYHAPTFSMVSVASAVETHSSQQPSCIVAQVETLDPALESWAQFKDFIVWCKTECGAAHFDMMACALYSNPDWKYIADTLPKQTGVDVRASTDETGSAALGGDWFLESHAGVNLKTVYFTELIETYRGVLGVSDYSLFITSVGTVYASGHNTYGQMGLGAYTGDILVPTLITLNIGSVAVSAGWNHSLFLTSTGTVYTAGDNYYGQLGLGDPLGSSYTYNRLVPTLITSNITGLNIVAVSAGDSHSLFLTSTGTVYATGYNGFGQLGLGLSTATNINVPTLITSGIGSLNIIAISSGRDHSLFLTSTGAVYATGANSEGQLGLGDNTLRTVPTLITSGIGGLKVVAISAGGYHSLFLTSTGTVYAAGYNAYGALGLGDTTARNVPTLISGIAGLIIVATSVGDRHSLFLTSTGTVYATGYNAYGDLGLGDTSNRNVPTLIPSLANIVAVSAGKEHSLFLTSTGKVYSAGYNNHGQLGLGDTSNRNVPTLMSGTYSRLMNANTPANFVGTGNGTYSIAYSYDGVRWIPVLNSKSIFSGQGNGIAYSTILSRWVAVGEGTTNSIAYSLDGITWFGGGTSIFSINGNGVGPLT